MEACGYDGATTDGGDPAMKRVTGIGGVFFKARDAKALADWYRRHLGVPVEDWGGAAFRWKDDRDGTGTTIWSVMPDDAKYFAPSTSRLMINYRVDDLDALLTVLRAEGCEVDEKVEVSEYGKFGWVMDPEGNRAELWQPPAGQ
jgi:predicted enzyme related to lactoylglutathione lyase